MSGRQEQNAGRRPQQRHVLVRAKQRGSAFRCRQPRASIACCRWRGDLPLPKQVRSAILASKSPGIRRMPDYIVAVMILMT